MSGSGGNFTCDQPECDLFKSYYNAVSEKINRKYKQIFDSPIKRTNILFFIKGCKKPLEITLNVWYNAGRYN